MQVSKGIAFALAAGTVVSVAGLSNAQTVCNRAVGPDVIVGALHRESNNTSAGPCTSTSWSATVNGVPMCAFSVGTTSCNVGNANLLWQQSTNRHPVISQNLYRVKTIQAGNGASYQTFEQLGQAWLKHGFCALTQFECCASCSNPGGCNQFLVPSCSDPYTAGRNAGQSSLGPKWQVNAYTGVFTYPPANPPGATSSTVARRNAVRAADLDATSTFFVEGQYVTQDDAAGGNQHNNASYRPCHFVAGASPNTWTMWLDSTTVREKSAIEAWKSIDPSVTMSTFIVPNEGKVIIVSKATNLNNGKWHYEYAVYNMNSHLSIGTFTLPLPAGAVLENVGFRDVDYRDGDGVGNVNTDSADWAHTVSNGTISWSTTPFAQNANANAIRWGTLYNFRFDTNVAPAAAGSTATIGMWRDPSLSYNLSAQVPGALPPSNCYANCDDSTTAPVLNVGDFTCFLQRFAAGESYANCDLSTTAPVLNVADFTCFLQSFANGCP
jgi:hypothetical protein